MKARLDGFAASRSPAVVETADGQIDAQRIFCRDGAAVLIDRYGCQVWVGYGDITDISPILPVAEIVALTGDGPIDVQPEPAAATVVPFPIARR
ncbi:hypothetical protein [Pseudorhodoplanes sp.]|uniref:hypothetical protein n=1 Tax=Pseudorhodoplanes sp. TaxID=1934341 RepID=UPI002CFF1C18|nr:hypothetical protein [Pseudorhodoplanes sp.]HWV54299.1 hypothetical protein [Pseudorhodoplanes sp.]